MRPVLQAKVEPVEQTAARVRHATRLYCLNKIGVQAFDFDDPDDPTP